MRLQRREKIFVSLAACAVGVFLFLEFLIFPFMERREMLIRGVRAKKAALEEMTQLRARYMASEEEREGISQRIRKRPKTFALFSFLEKAAGESSVKDHIKYMRPSVLERSGPFSESVVEMKLDNLTLQQLVGYVYFVESWEDVVWIKRMSIKDSKGAGEYLDVIIQVVTFIPRA